MVECTLGSIILRKGHKAEDVFLIVTGTVEKVCSEDDVYNVISAGGLIGEYSGLHDVTSSLTYRTVSYVGLCSSRMIRISVSSRKTDWKRI